MERLTTKKELLERLKDIRAVETIARKGYVQDTITFTNFEIVNALKEIKKDEDRHIALLTQVIEMLEK